MLIRAPVRSCYCARSIAVLLATVGLVGCAAENDAADRDLTVLTGQTREQPTLGDTLVSRQSRLVHALHSREPERLRDLVTADFVMVDVRTASSPPEPGARTRPDSVSYFRVVAAQYDTDLSLPDPVQAACEVPEQPSVVLMRLTDRSWTVGFWRRESDGWRIHRLMLVGAPPPGEAPIRGATC